MNPITIKHYLTERRLLDHPKVRLLGRGEANSNYLAEDGNRRYVVRIARDDVPHDARFETERHFILFIESLGIKFAPRSICYDSAHELHIVSYIEGADVSVIDLDETQMSIFVDQLKQLNRITYDQYVAWWAKSGQAVQKPQSLAMRNKTNIDKRLHVIRSLADGTSFVKKVLDWAEPKIDMLYTAQREAPLKTTFLHDDLRWNEGGGNIRVTDDGIAFIDWELSGFFENAAPEIGDVLGSIPSTVDKIISKNLYLTYTAGEPNVEELNRSIRYGVLWGRLGNPLWAAERYCILQDENHPNAKRYKLLAELGMKDAEFFFKQPFSLWF